MVLALPLLLYLGLGALWSRRVHPSPAWLRPRHLGHLGWISLVVICAWWLGRNLI